MLGCRNYNHIITHLGSFSINYDNPQPSSLRFVLGKCSICIIGFEALDGFEMCALFYRPHLAVLGEGWAVVGKNVEGFGKCGAIEFV